MRKRKKERKNWRERRDGEGGEKQTDRKIERGRERDRKEERARERASLAIKRDGEQECDRERKAKRMIDKVRVTSGD